MRCVLVLLVVVVACGKPAAPDGPPARRAMFYWRTTFRLSPQERLALGELHAARLYTRVFDVGWSTDAPQLLGKIAPADASGMPAGVELVPVVFVKNEVWKHPAPQLAVEVWTEVQARVAALGAGPIKELELDCDWTDSTRARYFAFLTELRALAPGVALSATIRLHQVKYRERTGVPPVDRGMLMFYNMGKFSPDPDARAIFDPDAAARYVGRIRDYPLALDAALPIWSWTVQVRDDQVIDLLQATDPDELAGLDFLSRSGADRYVATRTAFLHGVLLNEGDVLKIEVTGPTEALAAARMLAAYLPPARGGRTVALFDLSERNLNRHGIENLARVFSTVH